MSKADYILRSLSKISSKRWEHYIINRIWHRLDDQEIEFVCQQGVRSADGRIYLADFFLPQLGLYLEIDEPHHEDESARIRDAIRRFDIAEASGFEERRISVSGKTLQEIDDEVDAFIELVRSSKAERVRDNTFVDWDYERRYTAALHLEAGYIAVGPRAAFRTHSEAMRCFGYTKGHYQRGAWTIPAHISEAIDLKGKSMIWFPRLYEQPDWINSMSDDGLLITEINKNPANQYDDPWDSRIVMARSRDELGRNLYRFVGVFEPIPEFRSGNEHRFRRIDTRVKTYGS